MKTVKATPRDLVDEINIAHFFSLNSLLTKLAKSNRSFDELFILQSRLNKRDSKKTRKNGLELGLSRFCEKDIFLNKQYIEMIFEIVLITRVPHNVVIRLKCDKTSRWVKQT